VFSCSESEQKQLNTWVSFQSAEQPLLGQFSVSGNSARPEGLVDRLARPFHKRPADTATAGVPNSFCHCAQ